MILKPEDFAGLEHDAEFSALCYKGWRPFRLRGKVESVGRRGRFPRKPAEGMRVLSEFAVRVVSKHAKTERWFYLEDFSRIKQGW